MDTITFKGKEYPTRTLTMSSKETGKVTYTIATESLNEALTKAEKFYDVHVFHSRNEGFSVAIKSPLELSEDEAIALAVKLGKIDSEDAKSVDYVEEIERDVYEQMNPLSTEKESVEDAEAESIDVDIYFYVSDELITLPAKEICEKHLDIPFKFISE